MALDPARDSLPTGELIAGRYRAETLLGRGGMAAVYRAHDEILGRTVALKLFAASAEAEKDAGRKESEIRLLASLKHHSLVTLYDADEGSLAENTPAFMAMELVEGPTLAGLLEVGPLPRTEVERMGVDLAEALHVVHAAGIVHRDLKPSNVLLDPSPLPDRQFRVKLADFGIAYVVDSTRLTMPGTLVGTAAYLSPEQAKGAPPTPASDIYSLGLVLLEALTGERAFPGSMIESATARLLRDPDVPASVGYDWRSLLTAMTRREPAQRPDALDVARTIQGFSAHAGNATNSAASDGTIDAATGAITRIIASEAPPVADADAATALLTSASSADNRTALLDTPTRVAPSTPSPHSSVDSDATTRLSTALLPGAAAVSGSGADTEKAPGGAHPERRASRPGRRALYIIIVFAVVLLAAIAVVMIVTAMNGSSDTATPLPEITGPLGVHLQQLRDEVNQ